MKKEIRKILRDLRLEGAALTALPIVRRIIWIMRLFLGIDKRCCKKYLRENKVRKLHVGCGEHILAGWLNTDRYPLSLRICHLDATRVYPFDDEFFDTIFSEHMIEHIPYQQGVKMLSECYRVLKHGGKIRLSTPDLAFLMNLYKEEKTDLQRAYVKWATDVMPKFVPCEDGVFVINNFVRNWGHQFIYDEKILSEALKRVGFTCIVRCDLNESDDPVFRNLENEQRMPEGFLQLETMTLEAKKV